MSSKSSFPQNTLLFPPIIDASRRTSSHILTVATTKAPPSPLVEQIAQQPALRAGELDTGKATAPMEEISEDEAESFEDKFTFLSSFHFILDDFDIDSHNSDFGTLRDKANVKGILRKNLEHWHHTSANPSVINTVEYGYKIFTTLVSNFFQNNQSALQNANFVTCNVKELLKSGRIKENRVPLYIVSPLTVAKNSHNKLTLAGDIYELTIKYSIVLQVKWTTGDKNQIADALSRSYDFDDWETTDTLFNYLNRSWGLFYNR